MSMYIYEHEFNMLAEKSAKDWVRDVWRTHSSTYVCSYSEIIKDRTGWTLAMWSGAGGQIYMQPA